MALFVLFLKALVHLFTIFGFVLFEIVSHNLAQAGLKLSILPSPSPGCWYYRHALMLLLYLFAFDGLLKIFFSIFFMCVGLILHMFICVCLSIHPSIRPSVRMNAQACLGLTSILSASFIEAGSINQAQNSLRWPICSEDPCPSPSEAGIASWLP